jgi:hypothetical protein|tara:strand:+ start:2644 stop:3309 length:666 start_codon:yes stop_codon:yes gene_type:complete
MPTVRPSGAGDEAVGLGEVRDGGTVLRGGSNSAGVMTKNLSLADIADDQGQSFGSKVIANHGDGAATTDMAGVIKAQGGVSQSGTAGTTVLGYQSDGTEWIFKGGNVTTTIAGVANTTLIGGAAGPDPVRDNVAQLETYRDHGSLDLDVAAAPSTTFNPARTITGGGALKNYINPAVAGGSTSSADSAANTTRGIPGEFVYRDGSANPIQDDFKSKEAAEG